MGKTLERGAPAAVRRGRPRRESAGEVEERILDAATKVFLERGFEGASIEDIAEAARAGKPTIYARFPGKEDLFAAVVMRKVRQNTSLAGRAAAAAGSTTEERLNALATALLERALAPVAYPMMPALGADYPLARTDQTAKGPDRGNRAGSSVLARPRARSSDPPAQSPRFGCRRRLWRSEWDGALGPTPRRGALPYLGPSPLCPRWPTALFLGAQGGHHLMHGRLIVPRVFIEFASSAEPLATINRHAIAGDVSGAIGHQI